MKKHTTFSYVLMAVFTALICVFTLLVQIPIPATGGYANLGDGVILLCACLLSPVQACIAAGVGSMLADVLTGYMIYAPGTLIIKALIALIAGCIFRHLQKKNTTLVSLLPASLLAECWMVLGYFLYESVILGVGMGAISGVLGNIGQAIVGVLVCCATAPALLHSKRLRDMLK